MIKQLQLALTNFCNLRCIVCPQSKDSWRQALPSGFTDIEVIRKLTESSVDFKTVYPFYLGEPLSHPGFLKIVRMFFEADEQTTLFSNMEFYTNASFLSKEFSQVLFSILRKHKKSQINRIFISIDAATQNTYSIVRRGGDLKTVLQNIFDFLTERQYSGLTYPRLSLCFLVLPQNFSEAQQFIAYWKTVFEKFGIDPVVIATSNNEEFSRLGSLADNLFFRPARVWDEDQKYYDRIFFETAEKTGARNISEACELSHPNCAGIRKQDGVRKPCSHPFSTPLVEYNGLVLPCCQDNRWELVLGDLNRQSFSEIWWGEKAKKLRNAHLKGNLIEFPRCMQCNAYIPLDGAPEL